MPQELQSGIFALSGLNLSGVAVRYDSSEPAQIGAAAFARGDEIHLAPGQRQHLPHEAWHIVQQRQGRVRPTRELRGQRVNDDLRLEREADTMGRRALRAGSRGGMRLAAGERGSVGGAPVAQRMLQVGGAVAAAVPQRGWSPEVEGILAAWIGDDRRHDHESWESAAAAARALVDEGVAIGPEPSYPQERGGGLSLALMPTRRGHEIDKGLYDWSQIPLNLSYVERVVEDSFAGRRGTISLVPGTPLRDLLVTYVLRNRRVRPYVTDFMHEARPTMQALMDPDAGVLMRILRAGMAVFMDRGHVFTAFGSETRPRNFRITGIELVVNKDISDAYNEAKQQMSQAGHRANERYLFSGYGQGVQDAVIRTGNRPDIGPYAAGYLGRGKGHGALGRGAYFSDRFDKAMSYGMDPPSGNGPRRGRVVLNKVLLGRVHPVERDLYRHETHEGLVRPSVFNTGMRPVEHGRNDAELRVEDVDSIVGRGTYESGGSLVTAATSSHLFDSNEFLIRNADQIFPQFIIHFAYDP